MTKLSLESDNFLIGKRLHEARTLKRYSQTDLAAVLGVTFQQIQKYEKGKCRISITSLVKASEALEAPLEFFCQDIYKGAFIKDDRYNPRTIELIELFERIPHAQQGPMLEMLKALLRLNKPSSS